MKRYIVYLMFFLISTTACSQSMRAIELAAEAMERAKAVEAHIHAPKEYAIADRLFNRMNEELQNKKLKDANDTAYLVIDAANEAIRKSREKKDRMIIIKSIAK